MNARPNSIAQPSEATSSARTLRLFVLTALAAPMLLFLALAWIDWERLEQETRLRGARTVTALAEQALRVFDANAGALARIEERARGMSATNLRTSAEFNGFLRSVTAEVRQAENVGVTDAEGSLAALSTTFPVAPLSLAGSDFYRAHLDRPAGIYISEVMRVGREEEPKFMISRRRSSTDGRFDGVVFSTVAPTALTDFYRSITDPGDSISLARADGSVLARYPAAPAGSRVLPRTSALLGSIRSEPGGGFYRTDAELDSIDRLHAYKPVGGYPVYVSYGMNPHMLAHRWRRNLVGYGLVACFSTMLLALVGAAALRSASGEKNALQRARASAEAGARAETELSRAREREARDAAEASEGRFRRLVEANILPMAFRTFDGRILEANDAFLAMIGYPRRTLAEGRLRWDTLTPPEHLPLDVAAAEQLRASGKAQPFEKEYIARDGRRIPILIAAALLPSPIGAEALIATYYVDLTEQKRVSHALERERLALAESEARLRAIFESAPVGLLFAEAPSGRVVGGNGALERILGRPLAPSAETGGLPAEIAPFPMARALAGEDVPSAEMLYKRGDDRTVWIAVSAAPIREPGGRIVGGVVTVVDIDRERRALEDTRRLVDELNHRVKNTLAAVQSIAHQTMRSTSDPIAARQAFESRLLALSAAHDVLTRRNWDTVELPDMLEAVAATHGDIRKRWRSEGPRVSLAPRMALPLSLAFHELFFNARRHGALSGKEGDVHVTWILRNGADGGSDLEIEWRESGGPPVAIPDHQGFGMRMLKKSLALELAGSVDVEFAETGFVCRIKAPLRTMVRTNVA